MPTALKLLITLSFVVLTIGALRGENSVFKYFELQKSEAVLQETVANLETENELLQSEIQKISQSTNYARKILREKYHVTEENETIIFFAD